MGSYHEDAADAAARKLLLDPEWARIIAKAEEFRTHKQTKAMCEVFGQPYVRWSIGQLSDLAALLNFLGDGDIRLIEVPVNVRPKKDRFRAENEAALKAGLPEGVEVNVWGSAQGQSNSVNDNDGYVNFPSGMVCASWEPWGKPPVQVNLSSYWKIPLEIGHTDASRTWAHLLHEGAVARWPYGHESVGVLVNYPHFCLQEKARPILAPVIDAIVNGKDYDPEWGLECYGEDFNFERFSASVQAYVRLRLF